MRSDHLLKRAALGAAAGLIKPVQRQTLPPAVAPPIRHALYNRATVAARCW